MPRVYYTPLGQKMKKNYPDKRMEKAVKAVRNQGLSIRRAATKFCVPKSTLGDKLLDNHPLPYGGQTGLTSEEESELVTVVLLAAKWCYPMTGTDLRLMVKAYLDSAGRRIKKFSNNYPGYEWLKSFLTRHHELVTRLSENIKLARANVTKETISNYFANLEPQIKDVPPENIVNYDETNFSDDPSSERVIVRRGAKRAENVCNFSKSSTSVMMAATASGKQLPPYVIYKSMDMWDTWTVGGPPGTRYNRTKSGWIDMRVFTDWFKSIALPYLKKREGKKILIGDNLSSHLSVDVIKACEKYDISFILLPPNCTHLLQPLDLTFFRQMKECWRKILRNWKKTSSRIISIPKDSFPTLLYDALKKIKFREEAVIKSGFKSAGLVPFDPDHVLKKIPDVGKNLDDEESDAPNSPHWVTAVEQILRDTRGKDCEQKRAPRRKKIDVQPGCSVRANNFPGEESDSDDVEDPPPAGNPDDEANNSDAESGDGESGDSESDQSDSDESGSGSNSSHSSDASENEENNDVETPEPEPLINIETLKKNDSVLVRYADDKNNGKYFVGQCVSVHQNHAKVKFLRPYLNRKDQFCYPIIEDVDSVSFDFIREILPVPEEKRGRFIFPREVFN